MRLARKLHLYTGVFFAPGIIFFALSGFFQSFGWHEEHDGKPPADWVATISEIHKDQRLPAPRPQPPAEQAAPAQNSSPQQSATPATKSAAASAAATSPAGAAPPSTNAAPPPASAAQSSPGPGKAGGAARRPRKKSFPLQVFMGIMAISLIGSTLVGLWMAFQIQRNTAVVLGLLFAGTVIPLGALYIGIQP